MCRYSLSEYKSTYACFKCRKGFKRRLDQDLLSEYVEKENRVVCPECRNKMVNLGKDLRLPKKDKQEEWLAIAYLANSQFNFFTCGCSGIGVVPKNLQEAHKLMEQRSSKKEGEKLLERLKSK